jgi:hypothetical protein
VLPPPPHDSAAEKKDKTTHLALKEAKKLWDKRRLEEIEMKFELSGLRGVTKVFADPAIDLGGKKVRCQKRKAQPLSKPRAQSLESISHVYTPATQRPAERATIASVQLSLGPPPQVLLSV